MGEPALVGDDVVLGAVAGGDVVLGDQRDQMEAAGDLLDFLGLAFGDECTERIGRGLAFCRSGVHGLSLLLSIGPMALQTFIK